MTPVDRPHRSNAGCSTLLASLFTLLVAGCGRHAEQAAPMVTDAFIRIPPPGAPMAAGYFHLKNPGAQTLILRSISSPAYASIEMHETTVENGVSKMRALESVSVAAGEELVFESGGRHLMLSGPTETLSGKTRISVTLQLESADGPASQVQTDFQLTGSDEDHSNHPG